MGQINKLYLLLNREFPAGTAASSRQRILNMRANGRTYESQLAPDCETIVRVVGDFPVSEAGHVMAILSIHKFIPSGISRSRLGAIFDNMTFGWFEFDNGVRGAIAADFGTPDQAQSKAPLRHRREIKAATLAEAKTLFSETDATLTAEERRSLTVTSAPAGEPVTAQWTLTNVHAVLPKLRSITPEAELLSKKVLTDARTEKFEVVAQDDGEAGRIARDRINHQAATLDVRCVEPPSKGTLGFGRKPGKYMVAVSHPATVEVSYHLPAKFIFAWDSAQ